MSRTTHQLQLLVVHGNADAVRGLRRALGVRGWAVIGAPTAIDAVNVLGRTAWSAVLVGEPSGPRDGAGFFATLRRVVPRVPAGRLLVAPSARVDARLRASGALGCAGWTAESVARLVEPLVPADARADAGTRVHLTAPDALALSGSVRSNSDDGLANLRGFKDALEGSAPPLPARGDLLPRLQDLARGEPGAAEVAAALESDPAAVTAVLHAANVAGAGFATPAASVRDACVRLGTRVVLALGHQAAIRGCLEFSRPPWTEHARRWWAHVEAASQLARQLAPACGLPPEDAYLASLLSNLGELAILVLADRWDQGADCEPLVDAARAVMLREHGRLGEDLLRQWDFDRRWRRLAARHHDGAANQASPLARIALLCWGLTLEQGQTYLGADRAAPLEPWLRAHGCVVPELARSLSLDLTEARRRAAAASARTS